MLAMKASTGLGDDDELWSLILAMHWYHCKNAKLASSLEQTFASTTAELDAYRKEIPIITLAVAEASISKMITQATADIVRTVEQATQRKTNRMFPWRLVAVAFGIILAVVSIGMLIEIVTSYSCINEPVQTNQGDLACLVSEPPVSGNIFELWSISNLQDLQSHRVL